MPDKLGRWPVLLIALTLIIEAEVSAQVSSEAALAPSSSSRDHQTSVVDRQDGQHEASDTSQGFTKHLDRNVPAVLLITMVGALSTAAGAGGGALFVPLFNSLLEFNVKDAAAISQAVITGGAIAGASFALFQVHPLYPAQPLIDFDLALLLIPSLLLGTSIGVLLNHMFPVWLITIQLVCLLTYLTHKTLQKGLRLHRAEGNAPAHEPELHLVHIHQIVVEGNRDHPVHNLLRSISEEPNAPTVENRSTYLSLPTIAESQKHGSAIAVDLDENMPARQKEVALALVSSATESSAQQHFPEGILDKSGQLHRSTSHSSTQSLKIRSEADGPGVLGEATSLADPSAAWSHAQTGGSFSQASVLSPTASSSSLEDLAPLLPKSGSSHSLTADQSQDLPPLSVLHKQTIPMQSGPGQVHQHALCCLPKGKVLAAGGMWAAFAALQLAKGQLRACSVGYWAVYIVQAGSLLTASLFFVQQASTNQQQSMPAGAAPSLMSVDQSIKVPAALRKASAVAVGGGALASTIGMGGGVIMGPLLLSLQMHPLVTAATSTLMILFSSSAATLSFAVAGNINKEYALIYGVCNFLSSFAGVFLIGKVVRRTGKSAVIVILLACTMAAGALASAVFGGHESVRNFQTGTNLTFSSICS